MSKAMRALSVLLATVVAAGVVAATGTSATPVTQLTVVFWEKGQGKGTRVVWTVRCNPTGGTLARPVAACRALTRPGARALFAPPPKDMACTDIYGGPQVAFVTGTLQRRPVWARFSRTNGCEIARWQRVSFLLPPGGA